jgi:hypothetical protein
MAPSAAYYEWITAGQLYAPCRPIAEFVALLRTAGFTVYHKGDTPHMQAATPEDHTPFSATGWPVTSKRWIGHALDVMPNVDLEPLHALASRIIADRIADVDGTQWIKYINWTDAAGATWQYSWKSGLAKKSSTDKGHIHISARSDMDASDVVSRSRYNPLGGTVTVSNPTDVQIADAVWYRDVDPSEKLGRAWTVLWEAKTQAAAANWAASQLLARPVPLPLPPPVADPEALVTAFLRGLAEHPEAVDVLATAVASRLGMIPTAGEIAKAIGALDWRGTPQV